MFSNVDARHERVARRRHDARGENARRGRLARAVGTEESEDLTLMDQEIQRIDGR